MRERVFGIVTLAAAAFWLVACATPPALPVYGHVPPFQLTAQNGQPFDRAALDGNIWVADFIFTSCHGPCPAMTYKMRKVQDAVTAYPDVRLVSFTIDPEHDTPPVLAEYARRFQADPLRWFFLTGEMARLNTLSLETFKLSKIDGNLDHSTRFVLVDGAGRIRGYYPTDEEGTVERLLNDLRRLREQG